MSREPGYYWVRRLNKDGEPIGEPRIAELRASYVTWPWRSMGGENYGHDDIKVIARILPPTRDLEEEARKARGHIGCPEWPYSCPFRPCERLNRCLFVMPLTEEEKNAISA